MSSVPLPSALKFSQADIELLSRRTISRNPEAEPGVLEAIPAEFPDPNIELKYHLSQGMEVRCRHCRNVGKQPNHLRGFVVRSSNGKAILVGSTCGAKHYGDKWGVIKGTWDRAEDRRRTIERLMDLEQVWPNIRTEVFRVLHGPVWAAHDTLLKSFQDNLPELNKYLFKILVEREGDLYVMERYRDLKAEEKLPEDSRKKIFKWREKPMGSLQGREFLFGVANLKSRFGELFNKLCAQVEELRKLGSDLTTAQLKFRLAQVANSIAHIKSSLSRVRSLQGFMEPHHIRRVCDCTNDWHKHAGHHDRYNFDGRSIVWSKADQTPSAKCLIGTVDVPSTTRLDLYAGP